MKMFLVAGGTTGSALTYTDSTEILDPELGSWRAAAALPITMSSVRAANIDGRVLIFGISTYYNKRTVIKGSYVLIGGYSGSYLDTILEYDITADSYTEIGNMTQTRARPALTVVQYENFSKVCP